MRSMIAHAFGRNAVYDGHTARDLLVIDDLATMAACWWHDMVKRQGGSCGANLTQVQLRRFRDKLNQLIRNQLRGHHPELTVQIDTRTLSQRRPQGILFDALRTAGIRGRRINRASLWFLLMPDEYLMSVSLKRGITHGHMYGTID